MLGTTGRQPRQSTATQEGFTEPVRDSVTMFRALLNAMSRPGHAFDCTAQLPIIPEVHQAALATLLTLADGETPIWLEGEAPEELGAYLRFHTGCRIIDTPRDAAFGLILNENTAMRAFDFPHGDDEFPDRSATVIIQLSSFSSGDPRTFRGPGIVGSAGTRLPLCSEFWDRYRQNNARYPRGVDLILSCGSRFISLPRTARLED